MNDHSTRTTSGHAHVFRQFSLNAKLWICPPPTTKSADKTCVSMFLYRLRPTKLDGLFWLSCVLEFHFPENTIDSWIRIEHLMMYMISESIPGIHLLMSEYPTVCPFCRHFIFRISKFMLNLPSISNLPISNVPIDGAYSCTKSSKLLLNFPEFDHSSHRLNSFNSSDFIN